MGFDSPPGREVSTGLIQQKEVVMPDQVEQEIDADGMLVTPSKYWTDEGLAAPTLTARRIQAVEQSTIPTEQLRLLAAGLSDEDTVVVLNRQLEQLRNGEDEEVRFEASKVLTVTGYLLSDLQRWLQLPVE